MDSETEFRWEVQRMPRASKVIYFLPLGILAVAGLTVVIRLSGAVDSAIMFILPTFLGMGVLVAFFLLQKKAKTVSPDQLGIRLLDTRLYLEPGGRPVALSRAEIAVSRACVTADTPYGTLCSISEPGMPKCWRILSDVELTSEHYNGPRTTDLSYDLYMTPELFRDFVSAISNPTSAPVESCKDSDQGTLSDRQVFDADKPRGLLFVLALVALMFLVIAGLGLLAFLVAKLAPEYEDTAMMILVAMLPVVSMVVIFGGLKKKRTSYRLELSSRELVLTQQGRPGRIAIDVTSAGAFPVNWVSSGKHGRHRAGPGFEIHHDLNRKTRIATYDAQSMWSQPVKEIGSPHFVISRDAWQVLVRIIENQSQKSPSD
jgi:hypothetical protein